MINNLNIKILDYIFSTNVGLKEKQLVNSNIDQLCSNLSELIKEVSDEYDFWNEHKHYFNDNCVVDASTLSSREYIYNGFPKMKLNTKKEYLNYKMEQVKKSINNNGEFLKEEFELLTKNIINVGKKEILDYCKQIGLIEYKGRVFIPGDSCLAYEIIYDNIKAVLYTNEEFQSLISENIIVVNGNGNKFGNIEQNINSKNNDDELFSIVLEKLELLKKEGVSKSDLEALKEACNKKDKNKVVGFLKDVATGTLSSLIATAILYKFDIQ